jgi:hypothetical protein
MNLVRALLDFEISRRVGDTVIRWLYCTNVVVLTCVFLFSMRTAYRVYGSSFTRAQDETAFVMLLSIPLGYFAALLLNRLLAEIAVMLFRFLWAADSGHPTANSTPPPESAGMPIAVEERR